MASQYTAYRSAYALARNGNQLKLETWSPLWAENEPSVCLYDLSDLKGRSLSAVVLNERMLRCF